MLKIYELFSGIGAVKQASENIQFGEVKRTCDWNAKSNLVWEIERILKNLDPRDRPKYLTMENVPTLTTKFKHEFDLWLQALDNLGYKSIWFILNGVDFGSIQKRKRLFVISIKKTFWKFGNKTNEQIKEMFMKRYAKPLTFDERKEKWDFIFFASSDKEKAMKVLNNTKYQRKMVKECKDLTDGKPNDYQVGTVLTGQDKIPNIGLIKHLTNDPNKLPMHPITYREALLLMGLPNSKIDRLNVLIEKQMASRNDFIKMAGNSLCVEVYEAILKFIRDLEK